MTRVSPIALVSCLLLLGGCLFPSFDRLEGDRAPGSADASTKAAHTDPSTAADGNDGGGDATSSDGSTAPKPSVACGDSSCDATVDHCCFTLGGADCQPHDSAATCGAQAGSGDVVACDGAEDCTGGQICCYANSVASCQASCPSGKVLCNGPDHPCPGGTSCTGKVTIGSPESTDYKTCQ